MAIISITTSAREDKALTYVLGRVNATRAGLGQGALTASQYVDAILHDALTSYAAQEDAADADVVKAAYLTANNAKQATVKSTLGLP